MLMRRSIVFGAICLAITGCEEPPRIVPAAPPGTEAAPPLPASEKDAAEALGETALNAPTPTKTDKPAGATIPPALPTAPGETKTTPSGVKYETVKAGEGPEAKVGQSVQVHYTGTLEDGKEFDSSRTRGAPFTVKLGAGAVIRGWDEGIPGMKLGEVRKLTIPSAAGYGASGYPPAIPPDATLKFVVELIKIE